MSTSTKNQGIDVIIIGGGAAGMSAALFASRNGARVLLLEKNEKLGRKVYITGKGRCNITNQCTVDVFLQNVPRNPRFLYSALNFLSPDMLMALLEELGCPLKVERGRRVFPVSDKASDVTRAFERELKRLGCEICYCAQVSHINRQNNAICGVTLKSGEVFSAPAVVIATGGLSYPLTGSTGDGYAFAKALGHEIAPCTPSLVAYETLEAWPKSLSGLTLKNVCLKAYDCGKILYCEQGEMLLTHFGISGPLVLEMSCYTAGRDPGKITVTVDLKPALSIEQLDKRLQTEFAQTGKKQLSSILQGFLPARLAEVFPALCGLDGAMTVSHIPAQRRLQLAKMFKAVPLTLKATRPMSEAIITRGGVLVREVSPATMGSKRVPGLYFAGEVLDVDAHTGGYNLQIAFATGALAGANAAHCAKE